MLLRLLFADGKGAVMQVELLPDLCQEQVYLEFIVCRRRLYHLIDLPDLTDDVPVPVGFLPEPERMPGFIRDDKIYVLRLQEAVLISVDEPWMKGDRQVVAVCSILHITGMTKRLSDPSIYFTNLHSEPFIAVYPTLWI